MCVSWEVVNTQTFDDERVDDKVQHQNDDGDGRHHQTYGEIQRRNNLSLSQSALTSFKLHSFNLGLHSTTVYCS